MLSEKTIPPQGDGEIKVTYSAGKHKGQQSKSITVESNDPEQPSLALKVQGNVKEAVVCTPNRLNFGNVVQGESATQQIFVTAGEGERVKVQSVESTNEHMSASFSKGKQGDKSGYLVDVNLSPKTPRGRVNAQLKINTDNEHAKMVEISAMATITGEIAMTPERISLVIQRGESNPGSFLSVEKMKGEGLSITKVESSLENVTSKIQTVTAGKLYKIEINANPQIPIGHSNGTISIYTNDPNDPKIDVPLNLTVRGNLTVVPEQLALGTINQGQTTSRTITVTTLKDKLNVKKVETDSKFLKTKLEVKQPEKSFQISVSVAPDAPAGTLQGKVIIYTNDPNQPKVEVPVTGRVQVVPKT